MSHSIIVINDCIGNLVGDASTGSLVDLRANADAADASLPNQSKPAAAEIHEILERVQTFLCDGGTFTGADPQVIAFNAELSPFI